MTASKSLWGREFDIKKEDDSAIIKKIKSPKKVRSVSAVQILSSRASKKLTLEERLNLITSEVMRVLGHYRGNTLVAHTRKELHDYISDAISCGRIDIDTETNNSLDPLTCKIMGACLYVPGKKQMYVPINHECYQTHERLSWQLTENDLREEFSRLSGTKIIMHNGKFDYEVIKCTCGIALDIYWDTIIGARMLNENERASLKSQYIEYIDPNQSKYDIESLFKGVKYAWVEPDVFALYAATDAFMTDKLYLVQEERFKEPGMESMFDLFKTLEMPMVKVTAEMELTGISIDMDYSSKLSRKYHDMETEIDGRIASELKNLQPAIDKWKEAVSASRNPKDMEKADKLETPINLDSNTQLAILLYDIMKIPQISQKSPRGVGKEVLTEIDDKYHLPLCDLILSRRECEKLLGTYIDKLPAIVSPRDGRLHGSFNQLGTDTGRFSSSSPNLQNIPSKNREIRLMFTASKGNRIIGGDFSAQEPRLSAFYSKDANMLKAYSEGKDLYAVIAQSMYGNKYEDNLEFYPEGTTIVEDGRQVVCGNKTNQNKAGKERRASAKRVLLGILYGRGAKSIGEQLGKSAEEGQKIVDQFYKSFPSVKTWVENTQAKAGKLAYVEDFRGRRRHLPDILLAPYEASYEDKDSDDDFNPFIGCGPRSESTAGLKEWVDKCQNIKYHHDFYDLQKEALMKGIELKANTDRISKAERESVNAVVQGGAATLTKMAMLNISRDPVLNQLGFRMMITIHDEVLGECPEENSEQVAKRLSEVMVGSAKGWLNVPMKVDTYNVVHWYEDENVESLKVEYEKILANSNGDREASISSLVANHPELTEKYLRDTVAE